MTRRTSCSSTDIGGEISDDALQPDYNMMTGRPDTPGYVLTYSPWRRKEESSGFGILTC